MSEQSEPTTGEIVRAIRNCAGHTCTDCVCHASRLTTCDDEDEADLCHSFRLADRLESQERKIEWYNDLLDMSVNTSNDLEDQVQAQEQTIADLTARAEQAEATMKAIVDVIDSGSVVCTICANRVGWDTCKPCKFKWRGQPQDGEGL